ncbi:MAG: hypothetical protein ABUL43_03210, partial [Hyphomicrobium sp.]
PLNSSLTSEGYHSCSFRRISVHWSVWMQDLFWQLRETDSFTVYTTLAFAAIVFWFIREIVGSSGLAALSVPFLIAGGILGPACSAREMITLSYDKNINALMATALGVLVSLMVILITKWLLTILNEYRVGRTKLVAVPIRGPRLRR